MKKITGNKSLCHKKIKNSFLYLFCISYIFSWSALAENVNERSFEFDGDFLKSTLGSHVDITRFNRPASFESGEYILDVFVNDGLIGRQKIRIEDARNSIGENKVCFTSEQVSSWGVNVKSLPNAEAVQDALDENKPCFDTDLLQDFKILQLIDALSVRISIPQAYLKRDMRGYISSENWDQGISAGFVNYYLNGNSSRFGGGSTNSTFVSLNAGFNTGPWRLRHNGYLSNIDNSQRSYKSGNTYIQRDLISIESNLMLGQSYTGSEVFDSIPFTGIHITSDERMLPPSMSGFAPVVQGVADSNAVVSIYQNNVKIYQESVQAGPFVIKDLYDSGYSGDLEVVVKEADGREKKFIVPFSNVVQLLRPGAWRYSLTAGRYRDSYLKEHPNFLQGTYQRGVNNYMTLYGGVLTAQNYNSVSLGAALNTPLGAISADVTKSRATQLPHAWGDGGKSSGESYRISMNKLFVPTQTNLAIAAYRYSKKGYMSFSDNIRIKSYANSFPNYNLDTSGLQKNRFNIFLSQDLYGYGVLTLGASLESYWGSSASSKNYQLGYGKGFSWGSAYVGLNNYTSYFGNTENQVSVNFSFGLDDNYRHNLTAGVTHSGVDGNSYSMSVNGVLGEHGDASYGLYSTYQDVSGDRSNGASLSYGGHAGDLSISANLGNHGARQISLNASGGVIFHPGGVNLIRRNGDTFAVINAPDAVGAKLNNDPKNTIAANGYGVVSNLQPYRQNSVWIDPEGLSLEMEVSSGSKYVVPTSGAIVALKFETRMGKNILLQAKLASGNLPPLGAEVRTSDGNLLSQVGRYGIIFFQDRDDESISDGVLKVVWGKSLNEQCTLNYKESGAKVQSDLTYDQTVALCS